VMQCTTLLDRNGNLIYEGDLVVDSDFGSHILIALKPIHVDAYELIGYNLLSFIGNYETPDCLRLMSEIKLAGNMFENPELIDMVDHDC